MAGLAGSGMAESLVFSGFVLSSGVQFVDSGTDSGTTLLGTALQYVDSGGTAVATQVFGGTQEIMSGGLAEAVTIAGSGKQIIHGGIASGDVVSAGGVVSAWNSSATAMSATVASGGTLWIENGGTSTEADILAGGTEFVVEAQAISSFIDAGGLLVVSGFGISNGTALDTTIAAGGYATVAAGSTLSGGSIAGTVLLLQGATAEAVTLAPGGVLIAEPGAVVLAPDLAGGTLVTSGLVLRTTNSLAIVAGAVSIGAGQTLDVLAGADASSVTIGSGGLVDVLSGGTVSGATVLSGGEVDVQAGGTGVGLTVGSGAFARNGGTLSGTTIQAGGEDYVDGSEVAPLVSSGGRIVVNHPGTVDAPTLLSGAAFVINTDLSGATIPLGVTATIDGNASNLVVAGTVTIHYHGSGLDVQSGGQATIGYGAADVTIESGGSAAFNNGTFEGTELRAGATLTVPSQYSFPSYSANLTLDATTLDDGSYLVLSAGDVASGVTLGAGALLVIEPGATVSGVVSSGGTALSSGVALVGDLPAPVAFAQVASGQTVTSGVTEYVLPGGTVAGGTIDGGVLSVLSGGYVVGATVGPTGSAVLTSGANDSASVLQGFQLISPGAVASGDTILAGGTQAVDGNSVQIFSGSALAVSTTVASGGVQGLFFGTAIATQVLSGGYQNVTGNVLSAHVFSGGVENAVFGSTLDTTVDAGGALLLGYVYDASGSVVRSGGYLALSQSVVTSGLSVEAGGTVFPLSGATFSGQPSVDVISTGVLLVNDFGGLTYEAQTLSGVAIGDYKTATVLSGGTVEAAVVANGGSLVVQAGGSASAITIGPSGSFSVDSGGSVAALSVSGGAARFVGTGTLSGLSVGAGGSVDVWSAAVSGADVQSGGTLLGVANDIAGLTVETGGTVSVSAGKTSSGADLVFAGSGATATLDLPIAPVAASLTIEGLHRGNTLDVPLAYYGFTSVQLTPSGTLDIYGANHWTFEVALDPGYALDPADFLLTSGSSSSTDITYVACFGEGTRIATTRGAVCVEQLGIGETVITAAGRHAPVRWIGYRRVACGRHPRPWDVMPVRVCAGAFGPGVPARDLVLSPDHAVWVEGALIPVRCLLNGASVVQERVDAITYWHVELDAHDVLLAEGLPCESYLDTGNRSAFANGGSAVQAHPDFARTVWAQRACAPLVLIGAAVEAARRALIARLPDLGFAISDDPGLQVVVDGAAVEPQRDGAWWCIALPDGAREAVLRSHAAPPSWLTPTSEDTRPLGVPVTRLRLDGAALPLEDARLGRGWHGPEPTLRWTNGAGTIDVRGAAVLEFRLGRTERRPVRLGIARAAVGAAAR